MIIIKRNSNMLDRIYVQEYQLSIHLAYKGGGRVGMWEGGVGWRVIGRWGDSKKYLSELESTLNQTKRKQDDNNNKKNF